MKMNIGLSLPKIPKVSQATPPAERRAIYATEMAKAATANPVHAEVITQGALRALAGVRPSVPRQ